jgi:pyruvate,water dikinase
MNYTKPFLNLSKKDTEIAGGKGASLGEMLNAGIPVPDGFVVLSTTFDAFLKEADLIQEIDAILEKVDHKTISSVESASEKIQELIKNADMPESIVTEVLSEFKRLDTEFVAVRSSATAEDGLYHAWAGQLESYLNTTQEDLLEKVQHCWASLFTPRAIFYRFEKGLHDTHISVAVVVQKMVNSEKSGITFSVHPVTEDRNQLIIEAGLGLGEAIVSGSVTPDSYVVEKEPRNIIDININHQNRALYRKPEGGNDWKDLGDTGKEQVLNQEEILKLSEIILAIEDHYGFPCDIEWAYEGGKFYIVQSRPITTLTGKEFVQLSNVENYLKGIDTKHITKQEGNFSHLIYMSLMPEVFSPYISRYYNFDFEKALFISKPKYGILFFNMEKYLQVSRVSFDHFLESENLESFKEFADFTDAGKKIQNLYKETDLFSLIEKSETELLKEIRQAYLLYWDILSSSIFSEAVYEDLVKELYLKVGGQEADFSGFFSKGSLLAFESFALRFDKQLLAYSKDKNTKEAIWIFADYYDAPTEKEFLLKEEQALREKGGEKSILSEINRIETEINNNKKLQSPYYQTLSPHLKKLFDYMQLSMETRDIRKDPLQRIITLISYLAKALLYKQEIPLELAPFAMYQDFFSETYKESEYKNLLEKRKNSVVLLTALGPKYEFSDPDTAIEQVYAVINKGDATTEIKGNPASKGYVSGRARIILSEVDFHKFESGDILITSMTRPEFVPLMKMAKAVVTDEGGITCHAAIVSRELDIPCVIGTNMATRLLKDGDEIDVDANNGVVRIIK